MAGAAAASLPESAGTRPISGPRLTAIYGALAALATVPLALVRVPVLGDYVNNLARVHVLLEAWRSPALQAHYDPSWHLAPYLAMDLVVAGLAQVLPFYVAARVFAAICVVLPVAAAMDLRRTLVGEIGFAPALMFPVGCGYLLAAGFLNFMFAASLGVILFAAWLRQAPGPLRWHALAAFGAGGVGLMLAHPLAFTCYGVLIGAQECRLVLRSGPMAQRVLRLVQAAVTGAPAVLAFAFVQDGAPISAAPPTAFGTVAGHLLVIVMPYVFTTSRLGVALAASALGAAATALFIARAESAYRPLILMVLAAALCVPHVLLAAVNADFRLPFVLAILGAAALRPGWHAPLAPPAVALLLAAVVAARATEAASALRHADHQASALSAVLRSLPPGRRLLVADVSPDGTGAGLLAHHLSLQAVIERDAFVPFIFAYFTPLRLKPAAAALGSQNGGPISPAQLAEGEAQTGPDTQGGLPGFGWGGRKYWLGWRTKFDALLVTHRPGVAYDVPAGLRRAASAPTADLYLINPG